MKPRLNATNLLASAAGLAIVLLSSFIVWKEWRASHDLAEASVLSIARILADQVETSLDQADRLLVSVGNRYLAASRNGATLDGDFLERVRLEVPYFQLVARVGIVDEAGTLVFNSGSSREGRHRVDVSDRDYFRRAKGGEAGPIYAGPLVAKLTGETALTLARPIKGDDGAFLGVVFAILPVESIGKTFSRLEVGTAGSINLRTLDFSQVVRWPALEGEAKSTGNRNVSRTAQNLIRAHPERDHHTYKTIAPIDGIERVYAYQRFSHSPFWMTVGRATADFTSSWRTTAALMTVLSLAMLCLLYWAVRRLNLQNLNLRRRIVEETRAKHGLQASEARFRQFFDHMPVSVWVEDFSGVHGRFQELRAAGIQDLGAHLDRFPEELRRLAGLGRVLATNAATLAFLGVGSWEEVPRTVGESLPPEAMEGFAQEMCTLFEGGTRFESESLFLDATGCRRNVLVRLSVLPGHEVDLSRILVTMVDLTAQNLVEAERRRLEQEVSHLHRIEGLGKLAAGLSHDMNNVLGSIMSIASVLKLRHEADPEIARDAETMLLAAARGRDLVKGLRDFSRKELEGAREVDLNALAREEAELLERTSLKKIQVRLELAPVLPPVLAEASAISSALMNLCANSVDAMPKGGILTLSTQDLGQGFVELAVTDTGEGMNSQVLGRAMEPFYTTKPVGKGTGLGLSQVYGTMKAHGGTLGLRSEPGGGTRASLAFPTVASLQADAPQPGLAPASSDTGRLLSVLLVDDDDHCRVGVHRLLETLGHQVTEARGALEALRQLEEGGAPDLIMLDLNMPEIDGAEALACIHLLRPELPVLLCTGHADDRVPDLLERFPEVRLLRKPFTLQDIQGLLAGLG